MAKILKRQSPQKYDMKNRKVAMQKLCVITIRRDLACDTLVRFHSLAPSNPFVNVAYRAASDVIADVKWQPGTATRKTWLYVLSARVKGGYSFVDVKV